MQDIEHIILNRKLMKVWHVGVHWLNGKKTKSLFLVSRTKDFRSRKEFEVGVLYNYVLRKSSPSVLVAMARTDGTKSYNSRAQLLYHQEKLSSTSQTV
ncbi:hypothetical protein RRG08_014395 [Elysia crispata]|uniref:Uncharacterized protein n=1 Tax=Elysia crispata TaxID=231223 RepID=A0AAE0YV90_9GAST|nr:hypothetical protein RRG08_014395 [Elysia crispata]